MYVMFGILVFLLLLSWPVEFWRRKRDICKVKALCAEEKFQILDDLIAPFGYAYVPAQDVFTARVDAWQREFGYRAFYDEMAANLHMVFDCLPVYFDYQGRTWLIEFWKGQYGINTGCEIGVYRAERVLAAEELRYARFESVGDREIPNLSMTFSKIDMDGKTSKCHILAKLHARHWWLAAFRMGCFSWPDALALCATVTLLSDEMAEAFLRGLLNAGCRRTDIHRCRCKVSFSFLGTESPRKQGGLRRIRARVSQWENHLGCKLYLWLTRPFASSVDRLLYLYYHLPFAFRKWLRLKRWKRHRSGHPGERRRA